jgi:hypothetical protein
VEHPLSTGILIGFVATALIVIWTEWLRKRYAKREESRPSPPRMTSYTNTDLSLMLCGARCDVIVSIGSQFQPCGKPATSFVRLWTADKKSFTEILTCDEHAGSWVG